MEIDSAEIVANVNHTGAEKTKGKAERVEAPDSKARKKRTQSELPSPTADRPTRERKSIERLIVSPDKEVKEFRIPKGTGTALRDIPNIVFKLSKRRGTDEAVQALHKVLFSKTSKHTGKANILKFSGFVWSGNEEKEKSKIKERLERVVKETLFQMSDLLDLNLSKGLKKEEGVTKVFEFLESPHKTTDKLVEEKLKKGKKTKKRVVKSTKKAHTTGKSPKEKKKTPKKKQASDDDNDDAAADTDDEMEDVEDVEDGPEDKSDDDYNDKKKSSTRKRKRKSIEKSREESEDEEEISPKKSKVQKEKKKATPKAKKEKKPKSKTGKAKEPSDKELRAAITELLQNADFSKVTFTDVMKQLGDKFKMDLTHKKSHLKALIQEEIARLVGEAENEDEDSNTEGGEDEENVNGKGKDKEEDEEEKLSADGKDHEEEDEGGVKDEEDGVKDEEDGVKDEEDGGGVEDSDHGVEDIKVEKTGDEDADGNIDSEEDKSEGVKADEVAQGEGDEEA